MRTVFGALGVLVACGGDAFTSSADVDAAADAAADVGDSASSADSAADVGELVDGAGDSSASDARAPDAAADAGADVACPSVTVSSCGTGTVRPQVDLCVCGPQGCEVVMLNAQCTCYTCACIQAQGNYCDLALRLPNGVCHDVAGKGPRLDCTQ